MFLLIERNPQVESNPSFSLPLQDSIPVLPINLQANASSGMVPKDVTFKVLYKMDSDYNKQILKVDLFYFIYRLFKIAKKI